MGAGPLLGRTLPIGQVQGDFLGDPGDPGIFWGVSFGSFFVGGPFQLGRNPFFFFRIFSVLEVGGFKHGWIIFPYIGMSSLPLIFFRWLKPPTRLGSWAGSRLSDGFMTVYDTQKSDHMCTYWALYGIILRPSWTTRNLANISTCAITCFVFEDKCVSTYMYMHIANPYVD